VTCERRSGFSRLRAQCLHEIDDLPFALRGDSVTEIPDLDLFWMCFDGPRSFILVGVGIELLGRLLTMRLVELQLRGLHLRGFGKVDFARARQVGR